ncbi:MAG: methyltransferase domain-containing protein, partial [Planctomycetaceae bacterium]|nr:methyltransferase domain-containing protein [Planctomycetaceae bacterium]
YLRFLCCPECKADLTLHTGSSSNHETSGAAGDSSVQEGSLCCTGCRAAYPVRNSIPRFVEHSSYAESFGAQWKTFSRSQLDNENYHESQIRFDSEIGWQKSDLENRSAIEVGSGAGRFVDIVSRQNCQLIVGLDITTAVDAAQENLGDRPNVFFVQGDIFKSPIKPGSFDFAYSIGVLHHTPNPQAAFGEMVKFVRDEGNVAVSLYDISLYRRPNRNSLKVSTIELFWSLNLWRCEVFRQITTRIPDSLMILYCRTVIPVLHVLNKIPVIRFVRYLVPSTGYRNLPMICSMVDTMDTYSTKIVHQYRAKDVFQWFRQLGLKETVVMNSRAGWISLNANVGDSASRAARRTVLRQPDGPGRDGTVE